jgi:predicted Ser/Thr protein kinase
VPESLPSQDLNVRILKPVFWYVRARYGSEGVAELEASSGIPSEVLEGDGWVSHQSFESFLAAARRLLGSSREFRRACVYDVQRGYGPLLVAFPFLSGRQVYEIAARTMHLVTRISRYEVDVESNRALTLRYFTQRAESRLMCLSRRAQLPTMTRMVGLPAAELRETSCVANGDPCCTYKLQLRPERRWRALAIGAFIGLGAAALTPSAWMSVPVSLTALPALGAGIGGLVDLGARFLAQRRLLVDSRLARETAVGRTSESSDSLRSDPSGSDATTRTGVEGTPRDAAKSFVLPTRDADRYEVLEQLGRGGMGTVFLARDTKLNRRVALKLLHEASAADDAVYGRLVREAQALASLSHPNVVTVHDVGQWNDGLFLVMEYVDGINLKRWAHRNRDVGFAKWFSLLLQAADGLQAAHRAGLIHRDFKPSNVLLGSDGRVRVADFGLARRTEHTDAPQPIQEPLSVDDPFPPGIGDFTESGVVTGTPRYMAPEQFEARRLDPRCDQFAFAVVAYEFLCGCHPYLDEDTPSTYKAARAGRYRPPHTPVAEAVLAVLSRGLDPDRERRYPSMDALADALRRAKPVGDSPDP